MRRRDSIILLLALGAVIEPCVSFAQQRPAKIPRIGFLSPESGSLNQDRLEAFRAGLRDLGYAENKNVIIEHRSAEGNYDRLPELAAELIGLKVDVLVTYGAIASRAAKNATTTVPIVLAAVGDPVGQGLVTNLARPGGNITGSTVIAPELMAKRLEILKEVLPRIQRVAVLLNSAHPVGNAPALRELRPAAVALKLDMHLFEVRNLNEFETAFAAMSTQGIEAVVVIEDALFLSNAGAVASHASRLRIPAIGAGRFAESGGLIGYGVNSLPMYRHAAVFVDKILRGAKPGDLPIERAIAFEMLLNMKTAKAIGIAFPRSILLRANKVIE